MEEIFEYLPDAILIVSRNGIIKQVNLRACQMFGYEREDLEGLNVEALMPEHMSERHVKNRDDYFKHPHNRPMGSGLDLRGKRMDGSEFPVDITLGPLGDKLDAVVCAVRDITERRQLLQALSDKNEELHNMTQQLWQTAKLATMGELAASIAHELNNPLGIVSLRIEHLLEQLDDDDPKRKALDIVVGEVDRMSDLVSNLLQFSRKQAHQVSTLDIAQELDYTIELIHYHLRKRNIEVDKDYQIDVPSVQVDRQGLRQVILNVLTNASDAMPEGGRIRIALSNDNDNVYIDITDSGVGISEENLSKVMESFFTTKPVGMGTGLGLAICRRIIDTHQGELDITSAGVGQGTSVKIRLPIHSNLNGNHIKDE